MRRRLIAGTALAAACAVGAAGAAGVLGGGPEPLDRVADNEVKVRVSGSQQGGSEQGAAAKVVYPQTPASVIPDSDNRTSNFTVSSCPKGTQVVNGQVETSHPRIVIEASQAVGKRKWLFRLTDADGSPDAAGSVPGDYTAKFGLVCVTK